MEFGLKDIVINQIINVFKAFPEIEKAVLYGSRAKGNFKEGSDIDITFFGENINLDIMNKISIQIDDLLLPYTFDFSIYNQINNSDLIEHIDRVGKIFYKK